MMMALVGQRVIIFSIFSGHPPAHPQLFPHNVKCSPLGEEGPSGLRAVRMERTFFVGCGQGRRCSSPPLPDGCM